jgi:chromosome segregation ATPase
MLSPFNFMNIFGNLKMYLTFFIVGIIIFFIISLINKFRGQKSSMKENLIYLLIIIGTLFLIWFFFFKKESITKNYDKLINKVNQGINKYDNICNKYQGLASNWEKELQEAEIELKRLYELQEINEKDKEKIQSIITQNEENISNIKTQLINIHGEISIEKGKLRDLEKEKEKIEKEIKEKEKQLLIETNEQKKEKLYQEINIFREKHIKIVEEITDTKIKIKKLETTEMSLIKQLKIVEDFKQNLIKSMNGLNIELKKLASYIVTVEDKKKEIQNNINETKTKLEQIKTEQAAYKTIKYILLTLRQNAENWEKANEFSWGNITRTFFKPFDRITDLLNFKNNFNILFDGRLNFQKDSSSQINTSSIILPKDHPIYIMVENLIQKTGEEPKMISTEILKIYIEDINKELMKLDTEYKLYEDKYKNYKLQNDNNTIIKEIREFKIKTMKENDEIMGDYSKWIGEYEIITKELNKKQDELIEKENYFNKIDNLEKQKDKIEENIENKEIEYTELQQQNPNYAKIQQIIIDKKNKKIGIQSPLFEKIRIDN